MVIPPSYPTNLGPTTRYFDGTNRGRHRTDTATCHRNGGPVQSIGGAARALSPQANCNSSNTSSLPVCAKSA